MELYIADANKINLDDIKKLTPYRRAKAERLIHKSDKLCSVAAGLMISRYVGECKIFKNEFGKPYAENGTYFNISHSGHYVLLSLSDKETGCDIEQVRYVNAERLGEIVFCKNEMKKLMSAQSRLYTFFELWTKKESFLKCTGDGFHRNAKDVDVCSDILIDNGKKYYFKTWGFSDFTVSACSEENNFPCRLEFAEL